MDLTHLQVAQPVRVLGVLTRLRWPGFTRVMISQDVVRDGKTFVMLCVEFQHKVT
jgi:hypothetical protein